VVHVVTNKGQGYGPAVADKIDKFHGVSTFDPDSGTAARKAPDWTDIFGEALCEAAEADPTIVAITAAMASSTGLLEFAERFPDRFFDVGIAEQHAVTFAAGLAMRGLRPVVCIYSTFLQRAFDQVASDVALHRLPVTFVIDRAGITGADGPSHHGMLDMAYLRCIPGMTVSAPSSPDELRRLFATAISHDGPFSLRFPRGPAPGTGSAALDPLPIPSFEVRHRGRDIAVLAIGKMVAVAMQAQEKLAGRGVSTTVVDARFIKPLAPELSGICAEHRAVITIEDGIASGGFGSAVTELLSADGVAVPIVRKGIPDRFIEHGAQGSLLAQLGLDADAIVATALALLPQSEVLAG
jgi:1-deoxy-D-xylulose-5-phosphate synthase